jgi:hypothetical protein
MMTAEAKKAGGWEAYNTKMTSLFTERDQHPLESPERTAAAEKILALWYAEGS